MIDAFRVVRDFERAVVKYTGAPYVVVVNSCTMALLLAFDWYRRMENGYDVVLPARTYPSVPMSAIHAGLKIKYEHREWEGVYPVPPSRIWDCAKRFTSGMYVAGQVQCVSFHAAKHLKIGQGGAILHDDPVADEWYRRARFDGRKEGVATKDDEYLFPAWHCYLSPDAAARGLWLMQSYPEHVPDQEMHDYPDMSGWNWGDHGGRWPLLSYSGEDSMGEKHECLNCRYYEGLWPRFLCKNIECDKKIKEDIDKSEGRTVPIQMQYLALRNPNDDCNYWERKGRWRTFWDRLLGG